MFAWSRLLPYCTYGSLRLILDSIWTCIRSPGERDRRGLRNCRWYPYSFRTGAWLRRLSSHVERIQSKPSSSPALVTAYCSSGRIQMPKSDRLVRDLHFFSHCVHDTLTPCLHAVFSLWHIVCSQRYTCYSILRFDHIGAHPELEPGLPCRYGYNRNLLFGFDAPF